MRFKSLLVAIPAVLATAAFANPYSKPWAIVESGDNSTVKEESRLAITKIDGKSTRNTRKSDPIEPGKHTVTVSFDSARTVVHDKVRDVQMDLEGCTYYRIVAKYEVATVGKWEPKVYSEPIGECVSKFKKKEEAKK